MVAEARTANVKQVVLRINGLTKIFPGTVAVDDISMEFRLGEIHGIIGKNGAGKTTLVSILSGVISPSEGEIIVDGQAFKRLSRIEAKKQGIDIVIQEPQVIPMSAVYESLFLPDLLLKRNRLIDWKEMRRQTASILSEVGLDVPIDARMGDLSISLQQLLAIIRSFYITDSPIVVLDESSASLSESDRKILFRIIRKKKQDKAIIYISHRTDEILSVCDLVTVLRDGKAVRTELVRNLDDNKISSLIIGNTKRVNFGVLRHYEEPRHSHDSQLLRVTDLNYVGKYSDISFTVSKGEIVGLAGLRGSGRTEIMKAISGIDPPHSGIIELQGKEVDFQEPNRAFANGVAYLPEEREKEGIIDILSVEKNLNLLILKKLRNRLGFIGKRQEERSSEKQIQKFEIVCVNSQQEVKYLSGGNKQKVVFGKIYSGDPILYLLDEPTKGIDISTKIVLLEMIRKELTKNAGIVLTSPGLDDLMKICDRIAILFEGRILEIVQRKDFDEKMFYLGIQGIVAQSTMPEKDE